MQNRHWIRKWATGHDSSPAAARGLGDGAELAGGFLGDGGERFDRAQLFRLGEHPAQGLQVLRQAKVGDGDTARLVRGSR
ncbi:MAG: hypothetical protein IPL72_12435 [Sulfuritalea sp.]|nr:hypothetical protein [Sulfuritalea sp.]